MSTILLQLLIQLILIFLNAFFAATEIAVISLNEKKVKLKADSGDKKAAKMLKMITEPTKFLSTIQIGITLAGFLGSAFAADNFAEKLSGAVMNAFNISQAHASLINTVSVIVITLILSFFTLVFGELVPKRIAMKHKEKLAEGVCGIISFLSTILTPAVWLLTVSTNGVLRLFGIDPHAKEDPVSEEDIVLMLDAGADEGVLDKGDIKYIKNVFKLDDLSVQDVMTPRKSVVFIPSDARDEDIINLIRQEGYSRMPVTDGSEDNIIGILQARDYLLERVRPDFKIEDVMTEPTFVPESAHLDSVFKDMQRDHNHITIVVNEYGETAGIVTMEDIIEEIVGEIWDEHDETVENFTKLENGDYRVLCSASVSDFNEFFRLEPDEEMEASTVNGAITEILGDIPEKGITFDYQNLTVTVTKADEVMVHEINVKIKTPEPLNEGEKEKENENENEKEKKKGKEKGKES